MQSFVFPLIDPIRKGSGLFMKLFSNCKPSRIHLLSLFLLVLFSGVCLMQNASAQVNPNPCSAGNAFRIVVMGSSTAAGTGPGSPDSTWVNRYRRWVQSVNPANEVINIARGGYTTYELMPTGFVPPSGRPAPDTARNLTKALYYQPDAIIINLPSNDNSRGYPNSEQLANFDSMYNVGVNAGVKVWICTTQPKNYGGNAARIANQMIVRDSIFARYGPYAIDFWYGFQDSTNQLANWCNSGDGTHMNNAGHGELFRRVQGTPILDSLYQAPNFPDLGVLALRMEGAGGCGDSLTLLEVVTANLGQAQSAVSSVSLFVTELGAGTTQTFTIPFSNGLGQCVSDTSLQFLYTWDGGDFQVEAIANGPGDQNSTNDTLREIFSFSGHPVLSAIPDTGCGQGPLMLSVGGSAGDTVFWYAGMNDTVPVGTGPAFMTPPISATTSWWAQSIRGDLFFRDYLASSATTNINWNGTMFNLVPQQDVVVDSFLLYIFDTGNQVVELFFTQGNYRNVVSQQSAWTSLGSRGVQVSSSSTPVIIPVQGLSLTAGDTFGIHLRLANSSSRLRYQSVGSEQVRSAPALTMISGSGVAYPFGQEYYPRDWQGGVYYHFGSRPEGDCISERVEVKAVISEAMVDLGPDTILNTNATYLLDPGAGFAQYQWSNGSTSQTVLLDGAVLGTGIYTYVVTVTDSAGCEGSDTIVVVFAPLVGQAGAAAGLEMPVVYPNPSAGPVRVKVPVSWQGRLELVLRDAMGRVVWRRVVEQAAGDAVLLSGLPRGYGVLEIQVENEKGVSRQFRTGLLIR